MFAFCGEMASFEIPGDRWEPVDPGPVVDTRDNPNTIGQRVGAGDVVVMLLSERVGDDNTGEVADVWAYRPV